MISNLNGSGSVRVHRKKAVFTGSRFRFGFDSLVSINGSSIKFVSDTKYLGIYLNQRANDDQDILKHVRYPYCAANTARSKFHWCSNDIKTLVFRTYCMPMYCAYLWCNFCQSSYNLQQHPSGL